MKNKWKGLMILILIPVMFLVSCAPSSVVMVTEPGGKVVADNEQSSSSKEQQDKQQKDNKDNKENTKDLYKKDTKDNKKTITAKANSKLAEKQKKNNVRANTSKNNINDTKNIKNDNNSNVNKAKAEDKSSSKDVALAITEDNNSTDKQTDDIIENSTNSQQKDSNEAVNKSENTQNDSGNESKNNEDKDKNNQGTALNGDDNGEKGDLSTPVKEDKGNSENPPSTTPETPQETPETPETPEKPTTPDEKSPDDVSKWVAAGIQTVDVNGKSIEIPKGVKTVAAAGQYASIIGMIGGGDSIVGTSSDNAKANSLFSVVFKKGNSLPSYMPSAGYAMTEGQLNSILALQGDKKPQAIIADSATFAYLPNAVSRLKSAEIQVVTMEEANANVDRGSGIPANDSPYQALIHNVQVVGKMMDSDITIDGKHPEDIASDFNDYYDSVKSTLSKYHYAYDNSDTTLSSYGSRRWTYYVDSFGINTNDDGEIISAGDYQKYLLQGKSIAEILKNNSKESKTYTDASSNWTNLYGSSMKNRYTTTLRYGQENNFFTSALQMVNVENQYTNKMLNSNKVNTFEVSTNRSDHLIVKNPYTTGGEQVKLLSSWNGNALEFPAGEMTLNVQPEGINSWTSSSPESVLEPLWLATVFHKDSGVNIKVKIRGFYSKFYHYNLNNQQINEILKTS